MTARARRASPAVSCPHERDRRDCGTCSAAAHERAVMAAEVRLHAAPPEAFDAAAAAYIDALAAQRGHRILRENGIPKRLGGAGDCRACGAVDDYRSVCTNPRCPGRRVRCELPEVRGR